MKIRRSCYARRHVGGWEREPAGGARQETHGSIVGEKKTTEQHASKTCRLGLIAASFVQTQRTFMRRSTNCEVPPRLTQSGDRKTSNSVSLRRGAFVRLPTSRLLRTVSRVKDGQGNAIRRVYIRVAGLSSVRLKGRAPLRTRILLARHARVPFSKHNGMLNRGNGLFPETCKWKARK